MWVGVTLLSKSKNPLTSSETVRTGPPRMTEANYPYAKALQDGKWSSKNLQEAEVRSKKGIIEVSAKSGKQEDGLLKGCLIGGLDENI